MSKKRLIAVALIIGTAALEDIEIAPQCELSQLQEHIKNFDKQMVFYPTIKKLKKLYPEDTFSDIEEKECSDIGDKRFCNAAVELGYCNGSNHKVSSHLTLRILTFNFSMKHFARVFLLWIDIQNRPDFMYETLKMLLLAKSEKCKRFAEHLARSGQKNEQMMRFLVSLENLEHMMTSSVTNLSRRI